MNIFFMYPTLIKHIRRFIKFDDVDALVLMKYIQSHDLKPKEYILSEGQICRSYYFVEKGCLRMFFINDKTNEQITQFALDGWWITDYFSFMDEQPSAYYIQAIEKSKIVVIDKHLMDDLLNALPQLERYFRIVMLRALAASQLRSRYLYEMTKEEFYLHFTKSFPEFVQRVPQYMIASYLGLTPEYVSELRKKNL